MQSNLGENICPRSLELQPKRRVKTVRQEQGAERVPYHYDGRPDFWAECPLQDCRGPSFNTSVFARLDEPVQGSHDARSTSPRVHVFPGHCKDEASLNASPKSTKGLFLGAG